MNNNITQQIIKDIKDMIDIYNLTDFTDYNSFKKDYKEISDESFNDVVKSAIMKFEDMDDTLTEVIIDSEYISFRKYNNMINKEVEKLIVEENITYKSVMEEELKRAEQIGGETADYMITRIKKQLDNLER